MIRYPRCVLGWAVMNYDWLIWGFLCGGNVTQSGWISEEKESSYVNDTNDGILMVDSI